MGYKTEKELVSVMIRSYYIERNIDKILELVTDNIEWIGTEPNDSACGKDELRSLLLNDVKEFTEEIDVDIEEPLIHKMSENISRVTVVGRHCAVTGMLIGVKIRVTACCVRMEDGSYLVESMHASVPNSEMEKHSLEQTLMAGIPGGVAIYRMKKDGRIATEYVSESLAKMCGYTAEEFLDILKEDSLVNLVQEDIPEVLESVSDSIQNNKPINVIYHIYTKDKKPILVRLDANMIQEDNVAEDEVAIFYAVHTLVSDDSIKRLQEQKHYRDILNILGIAYWEWSAESGYYRSEKYTQYAISDEANDTIWNVEACHKYIHPDDIELYDEYVNKESSDPRRSSAVLRTKMKDGTYHWTEMFAFAEIDGASNLTRIISVMRDVDDEWLKQKEQLQRALVDAEHANRAKTDFLSRVSHDMRTPLNGILGITSLLQEYVTDYKIQEDLEQLEQSGKYLLNLINDTLDVNRMESGNLELNPVVCDGKAVFHNVLGLISPNMKERKIKFRIHEEELPVTMLYMDVGRVQQIIMNILGNAVKFTPEDGIIDFNMTNISVDNGVITNKIVIHDNGMGMSKEFLPRLFEPFTQERNTITSSSTGTGLGMTITKQIVDLMEGSISVESEVGKGTTFTLILPLTIASDDQVEEWKKEQEVNTVEQTLNGRHVLLCEDHPLNATIARRLLENRGIIVDCAENGQIAVDMFADSEIKFYDAILMDIRMPVMNGIDATKKIRSMDRVDARLIPIIAMTANALNSDIKETHDAGMNLHLSKPIETNMLYRALEELICI